MSEPDVVVDLSAVNPLHHAIGEAIEAYTRVEANLAFLLEGLLKVDTVKAYAIRLASYRLFQRETSLEMRQRFIVGPDDE
jgi:hypothetical protein